MKNSKVIKKLLVGIMIIASMLLVWGCNNKGDNNKKTEKKEFKVEVIDGEYVVSGPAVERLMGRVNIQDNESMHYFQKQLNQLGIEARLKKMGIKEGDYVKILEWEFEWYN